MLTRLKEELRIDGHESDARLMLMLEEGKAYINSLMGVDVPFERDKVAERLLLAYVRYAYNDAGELFPDNYHQDILRLQIAYAKGVVP